MTVVYILYGVYMDAFDIYKILEKTYCFSSRLKNPKSGKWITSSLIAKEIGMKNITKRETNIISQLLRNSFGNFPENIKRDGRGRYFYLVNKQ